MPCFEHQKLENDVAQALAALKSLTSLKKSNPNAVREEEFDKVGGQVADANYKLRTHVTTCPECRKEDDSTAS